MAKKKKEGDVPAFPDMQNLNAQTADSEAEINMPGSGLKKCRCVTKHFRKGELIPVDAIRYFSEAPEHFEAAE